MYRVIKSVLKKSIAERHNIEAGDNLLSINGEPVLDYIDYAYFMGEKELKLLLRKKNGGEETIFIQKEDGEDIGLVFAEEQMGDAARCRNKCVFCFVDQLPRGLRDTLYVKDDDWRLSFLMGNYITLTNLTPDDIDRIIKRKISPLYVSVHSTDDEVRERLLGNRSTPPLLPMLKQLIANGIRIHAQIVVCQGINDGDALIKTVCDLFALHSGVGSVAVVPVGLTRFRDNLPPLPPVSAENASKIIGEMHNLQETFLKQRGTRFVFCSDELYIRAKRNLPAYSDYEDFAQIENGVGLIAQFMDGIEQGIADFKALKYHTVSVATGADFAPFMKEIAKKLNQIYNININVFAIQNDFFGPSVTVTGLLCGGDIIRQLKGKELGEKVFLCGSIFRQFQNVTLDNITAEQIGQSIHAACEVAPCDGYEWIAMLAGEIE